MKMKIHNWLIVACMGLLISACDGSNSLSDDKQTSQTETVNFSAVTDELYVMKEDEMPIDISTMDVNFDIDDNSDAVDHLLQDTTTP